MAWLQLNAELLSTSTMLSTELPVAPKPEATVSYCPSLLQAAASSPD